jgi:hypothetical protein
MSQTEWSKRGKAWRAKSLAALKELYGGGDKVTSEERSLNGGPILEPTAALADDNLGDKVD